MRREKYAPYDPEGIREIREKAGMTQEAFAREIGVTFATVNRWENAKAVPSTLACKLIDLFVRDKIINPSTKPSLRLGLRPRRETIKMRNQTNDG